MESTATGLPEMVELGDLVPVLHKTPLTLQRMARAGQIPGAVRVGRRWLVPTENVRAMLRAKEPTPADRRRELLGESAIEFLAALAAAAPKLTPEQRDTIRSIFAGSGD
jgi:hypothetical protein